MGRNKKQYILIGITNHISEVMEMEDIMGKTGWGRFKCQKLLLTGEMCKGKDGNFYQIDELLKEEDKPKRMTNRQLAEWLSKGKWTDDIRGEE